MALLNLPCWWRALCLLVLCSAGATAENLVANPGFEDLAGDKPSHWDQFVQPMPGAVADLSDAAHNGAYAVRLHIPAPYDKEPVNNWSQNIIGDFGGQTLQVSGFIRVEEAKEAAIWLQIWRKKPWGVLGAASTSIDMPVYGTGDWQEVSMEVPVPEGADFVTLRCVLMGTGTAWFDDLFVGPPMSNDAPNPETVADPPEAVNEEPVPDATLAPKSTGVVDEAVMEAPHPADIELAPEVPQETVLPMMTELEAEVRRLRDTNALLTDTLQEIQGANQALLKEMMSVQEEIRRLKEENTEAAAPALVPEKRRVPPLVPLSRSQEYSAP